MSSYQASILSTERGNNEVESHLIKTECPVLMTIEHDIEKIELFPFVRIFVILVQAYSSHENEVFKEFRGILEKAKIILEILI